MGSPHRIHHDLYRGAKVHTDPGTGNTIRVNKDLQICEMVSVGADETRTLANPTKAGIRFVLRMLTDGGDIVVTASNGFNSSLETDATFADAADYLSLISVSLTATTYRWEILEGNVGTVLSTSTATATSTATSTATTSATLSRSVSKSTTSSSSATATSTGTATDTISITGTDTASVTKSVSASQTETMTQTRTATDTATATGTSTPTASATATSTSTATATGTTST